MRGVVAWTGGAILMAAVTAVQAGQELTRRELQAEMVENMSLGAYVRRNGPPDLAEWNFLSDRPPWDEHEVRLYYLDLHKEIAFARATILGRREISMVRYERTLTDDEVAALASRAKPRTMAPASKLGPAERAEEAARRAEAAAGRVEAAADAAERAADRTEAIVAKMESMSRSRRSN